MVRNDARIGSPRAQDHHHVAEAHERPRSQQGPSRPATSQQMEHFLRIRQTVKRAIAAHHTFMIHGRSRVVRDCLLNRGWCEKYQRKSLHSSGEQQLSIDSNPSALMAGIGNLSDRQNERLLISKMLGSHTVDLLWNASSEWTGWPSQDNKTTIFNRYTRANFTSKVGLCLNVRQMHWYYEAGIANTLFPRCYNLSQSDQMHAFIEDFRLTACLSLLKWLMDKVASGGEEAIRASNGIVPLRALDFAIGRCSDFIASKSHEDIDQEFEKVWSHQWDQFITWYYKLLHEHAVFIANNVPINKYLLASRHLLKKIKPYWPQLEMDGTLNIWILKPGNKSRGRGIVLVNKLEDILGKVNPANKITDTRFVVQKYIERPLLIYDTKFDIRQWFIVTNAQPLTLWLYRESYLRFCSQKFSLTDFHESIHLSNNAVQRKYKNSPDRDKSLPAENMWDVSTFKEYLKGRGDGSAWEELIYPGMKQGLVGSLLASQEAMDRRKNSFELYGADFMVMEDYSVWLIEINSHPDMSYSTSVTTRLCRKAMEDTIKVVIDYRENSNASTGDFELVYKQKLSNCQAYLGTGLSLHGTRISIGEKRSSTGMVALTNATGKRKSTSSAAGVPSALAGVQESARVGPILVDLIEQLELQLDREFCEYLKLRSANGLARQSLPLRGDDAERTPGAAANGHSRRRPPPQLTDCETNTSATNVALLGSNSQTMLLKNPHGKVSRNGPKTSPYKRIISKHKAFANHLKQTDASVAAAAAQSGAKTLVTKIIDLQKDAHKGKNFSSGKSKSSRNVKPPEISLPSDSRNPDSPEDLAIVKEPRAERRGHQVAGTLVGNNNNNNNNNNKVIPSMPSALITPVIKDKGNDRHKSRSARDDTALSHVKQKSRALSSHALADVKEMLAVGLAVSKES